MRTTFREAAPPLSLCRKFLIPHRAGAGPDFQPTNPSLTMTATVGELGPNPVPTLGPLRNCDVGGAFVSREATNQGGLKCVSYWLAQLSSQLRLDLAASERRGVLWPPRQQGANGRYPSMFTKKPEAGDSVTKMGERLGGETYGAEPWREQDDPLNYRRGPYDHRQCRLQG